MEKVDLIYKINGDFEDGLDVFQLAPVLLSLGQLISESQRTIFPNSQRLAVNVRPFKQASFDIQLILHPMSNLQQILEIIRTPNGRDIKELLQYIGLIIPPATAAAGCGISLIKLIKWLKGKPKQIEKTNSTELKYTHNDGNSIVVKPQVHALYQNVSIQQTIYNGIAKPFENEKVENIECSILNDGNTTEKIEKDIVEPCRNYAQGDIPSAEEPIQHTNARKLWVHPKRISCEGESNTWSFRIAGSEDILRVTNIRDAAFLENVKSNRYRLSHTDKLNVEILESQIIQGHKETLLCEIVKVIEYVKSDEQTSIDFAKGEEK